MGRESTNTKRSGRWIIEEEDFARACIDAFNSGLLSQVEEGTTLRAFLSERLQCQPMRVTKKLHGSKGMGKRLYVRAKDSTPALMEAAARELEALEARFAKKLLARSNETPVPLHHPRVVANATGLERPGAAASTTPRLPLSPTGGAMTAAASPVARCHHRLSRSAGGADMGAKGSAAAAGGGKFSHRRPRIYSHEDPQQQGTSISSPRHTRFSTHRKLGAGGRETDPTTPPPFPVSSVKMRCGDGDRNPKGDFDGSVGGLGGSERKSDSALAAAETPCQKERKGGNDPYSGGSTAGFLTTTGFTEYRSDSILPPLLNSCLQGEDGPYLGSDDVLQHPTLPDVGPSLSPELEHQDGGHPVSLDSGPGYSTALKPSRDKAFSNVGASPTGEQQRRRAPAMTAPLDADVAFLRARERASGVAPAEATAVGGSCTDRDTGHGDTADLVSGALLPHVAEAKAKAVVSSLVVPMDMDMDNDWLQLVWSAKPFVAGAPSAATSAVARSTASLEDGTMDDWIPAVAATAGPPLLQEKEVNEWWATRSTEHGVLSSHGAYAAATLTPTAPAVAYAMATPLTPAAAAVAGAAATEFDGTQQERVSPASTVTMKGSDEDNAGTSEYDGSSTGSSTSTSTSGSTSSGGSGGGIGTSGSSGDGNDSGAPHGSQATPVGDGEAFVRG
eukprot:g12876.t1